MKQKRVLTGQGMVINCTDVTPRQCLYKHYLVDTLSSQTQIPWQSIYCSIRVQVYHF